MASIQFNNISKCYGNASSGNTLQGINLSIADGEFCVFIGPSGCGKSTLMRMVAGLEDISDGDLLIDGERVNDTPPAQRGVAMVFQSYALYPHMTVYDNLSFGLRTLGQKHAQYDPKVLEAAKVLQLDALLTRKPASLSGGQRQRVAIGRAIVRDPKVFLFDEPLSNLDAALRVQTRLEIAKLHATTGATMIYVTHDQVEAMTLANRIVLLNTGQRVASHGSIAQVGTPLSLYHRPNSLFVAGFIGSPAMNFLPAQLQSSVQDNMILRVHTLAILANVRANPTLPHGAPVTLGIRPEHVAIVVSGTADSLPAQITHVERLGDASYVYAQLSDGATMTVSMTGNTQVAQGDAVGLHLAAHHLHVFDALDNAFERTVELPK